MIPFELASTGATLDVWIPIVGGILLLAGIAAVVIPRLRRSKKTPVAPAAAAPETEIEAKPFNEDRQV